MKKYLAFGGVILRQNIQGIYDNIGTFVSFAVHITIFNELWYFVIGSKSIAGFTQKHLIWYVILGEVITYSFHNYWRAISAKVESGFIAYDMSKPYNFILRIISEGIANLPNTFVLMFIGSILGILFAGKLDYNLISWLGILLILALSCVLQLMIHIVIGLSSLWFGRDVSSLWLLVSKSMLIFVFTPVDLLPSIIQTPLKLLPTTCVVYTPSKLLVHFSNSLFVSSLLYELLAFVIIGSILALMYVKGVKKLNANGI